jgi:hypothetical protein
MSDADEVEGGIGGIEGDVDGIEDDVDGILVEPTGKNYSRRKLKVS